mgnify:FL=1
MRGLIAELVSSRHQITVTDMEAGLEHLSRSGGTLRHVDQLFIITEMDRKASETARRTFHLAQELGVARVALIGNKLRDANDHNDLEKFAAGLGIEIAAAIAFDEDAHQADRRGIALYDYAPHSTTVRALEQVVSKLEHEFELVPAHQPITSVAAPALSAAADGSSILEGLTPKEIKKRFPECD